MERQRHLRPSHRVGAIHMNGDSTGVDTQIADLAGSGIQVWLTVSAILTGFGVGEPLAASFSRAAFTVPLLVRLWPLEVTLAVMSANMEMPWFAWSTPRRRDRNASS